MTFDGWMNLSGISGVCLVLGTYYLIFRGRIEPYTNASRLLKLLGFALIFIPLGIHWYLASSLLLFIGISMILVAGFHLWKRRI